MRKKLKFVAVAVSLLLAAFGLGYWTGFAHERGSGFSRHRAVVAIEGSTDDRPRAVGAKVRREPYYVVRRNPKEVYRPYFAVRNLTMEAEAKFDPEFTNRNRIPDNVR